MSGDRDDDVVTSSGLPYVFEYANGDGNDIVSKDVRIKLLNGVKVDKLQIEDNDIIYKIGSGSITVKDGVNGPPNSDGYFYYEEELPAATIQNLPALDMNFIQEKLEGQMKDALNNFLLSFETYPMKSILEDGKNSPYLVDLDPADAEQLANIIKNAYDNAKTTQSLLNRDNVSTEEYQQYILQFGQTVNDLTSLSGNVTALLGKYAPSVAAYSSVGSVMGILGAATGIFMSNASLYLAVRDFDKRYPSVGAEAWLEVIGEYPTLAEDSAEFRREMTKRIREVDPERYDKKEEAKIGALLGTISGVAGGLAICVGIVGGTALAPEVALAGLIIATGTYFIGQREKVRYADYANTYLTDLNPSEIKNWAKGKGSSSDLAVSADVGDGGLDYGTLTSDAGNDTIANSGDYALIAGYGSDNDIANFGDWSTITAGDGKDTVGNIGDYTSIDTGAGDDEINNAGESVTVNAGDGENVVENVGNSAIIITGDDDDFIDNTGNSVTIGAGAGVDYIINYGSSTSINAGKGDDVIFLEGGLNNIISYASGTATT